MNVGNGSIFAGTLAPVDFRFAPNFGHEQKITDIVVADVWFQGHLGRQFEWAGRPIRATSRHSSR